MEKPILYLTPSSMLALPSLHDNIYLNLILLPSKSPFTTADPGPKYPKQCSEYFYWQSPALLFSAVGTDFGFFGDYQCAVFAFFLFHELTLPIISSSRPTADSFLTYSRISGVVIQVGFPHRPLLFERI
jgi:hypothetical protein